MRHLNWAVYGLPIGMTVWFLAALYLIWQALNEWQSLSADRRERRLARGIAAVLLVLWLWAVLHMTVFSRESGETDIQMMPFYFVKQILDGDTTELLRTSWMNVLLFLPVGLLLDFLLPVRWKSAARWALVLIACLVCSAAIEYTQALYALGRAEADDVLFNVLGGALGVLMQEGALKSAQHSPEYL